MPKKLFFALSEEKQQRILQSAADEFIQYKDHYVKSSVKRIASRANIAIGSIYKYFDSKDDIFFYLLTKDIPGSDPHIELSLKMQHNLSRFDEDPKLRELTEIFSRNIDILFIPFIKYHLPMVYNEYRSILVHEKEKGRLNDSVNVEEATFLFLTMDSISSLYKKIFGDESMDNLKLSEDFLNLLLHGLYKH